LIQAIRGLQWLSRLVGACELTLGLVIWFVGVSSVSLHILLGSVMTLILLIVGAIALPVKESRSLVVVGILYAFILSGFGMVQTGLLIGPLHWLVQVLHLLIGVGSIAVVHLIGARYLKLKKVSRIAPTPVESVSVPQSASVAASDEA
jgi:hypothetical protein